MTPSSERACFCDLAQTAPLGCVHDNLRPSPWGPRRVQHKGTVVIEKDVFIGPHCLILPLTAEHSYEEFIQGMRPLNGVHHRTHEQMRDRR